MVVSRSEFENSWSKYQWNQFSCWDNWLNLAPHAGQGHIQNEASEWHLLWAPAEAAPVTKQSQGTPCTLSFRERALFYLGRRLLSHPNCSYLAWALKKVKNKIPFSFFFFLTGEFLNIYLLFLPVWTSHYSSQMRNHWFNQISSVLIILARVLFQPDSS